jgi:hypothetical protein
MDVPTTFDAVPDAFVATGIDGSATGIVVDGGAHVQFTPGPGIFAGNKVFLCDGSDSGMVVRLNARFGNPGSVGTWAIIDAWGVLDGLRGSGSPDRRADRHRHLRPLRRHDRGLTAGRPTITGRRFGRPPTSASSPAGPRSATGG